MVAAAAGDGDGDSLESSPFGWEQLPPRTRSKRQFDKRGLRFIDPLLPHRFRRQSTSFEARIALEQKASDAVGSGFDLGDHERFHPVLLTVKDHLSVDQAFLEEEVGGPGPVARKSPSRLVVDKNGDIGVARSRNLLPLNENRTIPNPRSWGNGGTQGGRVPQPPAPTFGFPEFDPIASGRVEPTGVGPHG